MVLMSPHRLRAGWLANRPNFAGLIAAQRRLGMWLPLTILSINAIFRWEFNGRPWPPIWVEQRLGRMHGRVGHVYDYGMVYNYGGNYGLESGARTIPSMRCQAARAAATAR